MKVSEKWFFTFEKIPVSTSKFLLIIEKDQVVASHFELFNEHEIQFRGSSEIVVTLIPNYEKMHKTEKNGSMSKKVLGRI